ncbi:MAG: glycosyltransferase family 4 protein [Patescibacteria group bacterium]
MKNILITTGVYPPEIGGPATYSKLLFDELPKRGYEVEVLPFNEVRHLPKGIRHIVYFFKILKKAKGVDIIYAQDPVSVGFPSMLMARILNKRFFVRIAGDYAWEQGVQRFGITEDLDSFAEKEKGYNFFVKIFKTIQTWVAGDAENVIVPSYYFKGIIEKWGIDSEKIKVIYNGIRLNESNLPAGRQESKVHNVEGKVLLSVGRLVPWKGFKVLIECIPELLKEIPNLKLKIVGSGPQKEELENLINELDLNESVVLAGQLSREELLEEKKRADIFVFNTNWESFSFDTVEAMSLGLPVIATEVGPLPELIENGKEGILVEPNNKDQIIESILFVLKNNKFREKIIKNARLKVQRFSIENTLDELEKVL